jgi:hypothetical protein
LECGDLRTPKSYAAATIDLQFFGPALQIFGTQKIGWKNILAK